MIKKTIYNDLDVIQQAGGSFFTGVDDQINLYLDPLVTGYGFIYWVSLPSWFEQDEDLKHFKALTEKNFKGLQGISALELQTVQQQTGFAAHEANYASTLQRGNTDFQITHKEFSGSPMTKMYQKWISMIRDPRTNLAIYPKLYGVEYGARNHTGQLLYIMTRPDATNAGRSHVVEYASFWSNVLPTNVPLDTLYNYQQGSQDSQDIEISFRGFPEIGPNVNAYAEKILKEQIMSSSGNSYIPFVDMYNTNTSNISTAEGGSRNDSTTLASAYENLFGTSVLKEIYEDTESTES